MQLLILMQLSFFLWLLYHQSYLRSCNTSEFQDFPPPSNTFLRNLQYCKTLSFQQVFSYPKIHIKLVCRNRFQMFFIIDALFQSSIPFKTNPFTSGTHTSSQSILAAKADFSIELHLNGFYSLGRIKDSPNRNEC